MMYILSFVLYFSSIIKLFKHDLCVFNFESKQIVYNLLFLWVNNYIPYLCVITHFFFTKNYFYHVSFKNVYRSTLT